MMGEQGKRDCLCGCGRKTSGEFASGGCDQFARTAVIGLEYGNTARFLERHGYGRGGRNLRDEDKRRGQSGYG